MKKRVPSAILFATLCLPAVSHAIEVYIFGRGGLAYTKAEVTSIINPRNVNGFIHRDYKNGVAVGGLGTGLRLNANFRLELEGSMQAASDSQIDVHISFFKDSSQITGTGHNKINVNSQSLLLKGYYDIPVTDTFSPFFMAGLGYSRNETSGTQTFSANPDWNKKWDQKTNNNFAWTVGTGFSYLMNKNLSFDLGVEYQGMGLWELDNLPATGDESFKGDLESFKLLLGIRYQL